MAEPTASGSADPREVASWLEARAGAALAELAAALLIAEPRMGKQLAKRFPPEESLAFAEVIAGRVIALTGRELPQACADYVHLNAVILREELHFRRHGRYRLSTFAEADREVYSDGAFMTSYLNGLLLSQVLWKNHTDVLEHYVQAFIKTSPSGRTHLEIGPGHGLLLALAMEADPLSRYVAWDLSRESLAATGRALHALGFGDRAELEQADLFEASGRSFDTIVLSEVLEHIERPFDALRQVRSLLAPNGQIFINVPVNAPAPDHIVLFRTPEEVYALVEQAGLHVRSTFVAARAGETVESARRDRSTLSVAVIAAGAP